MSPEPSNPFAAPSPIPSGSPSGKPAAVSMQYLRSFQFVFEHPQWTSNLLLATLCHLIPMVGPLVLLGYMAELIEALHRRRTPGSYPAFDFSRFGDYLTRGLWPFLVLLVTTIVVVPLCYVAMILGFVLAAIASQAAGGGDEGAIAAIIVVGLTFVLFFVLMIGFNVLVQPMVLAAELTQDFGSAFRLSWIQDFVTRVGKELLVAMLFLVIGAQVVCVAGLALCFVGVYPAITLVVFAQAHLNFQLYELYLSRGGEPLALKPERPPVVSPPSHPPF